MIGVIAKPGQLKAVEEFFQLFKTPWEFYHASKSYPVVIATCGDVSNVHTKLLLIYSAGITPIDSEIGIASGRSLSAACVSHRGKSLPIYGQCRAFDGASDGRCCVTAGPERVGVMVTRRDSTVIRLGYDLFEELDYLLSSGQPLDNAGTPTLDVHIEMLKAWIVEHGISLLEIPPVPAGHTFTVCLTHDIDFIGIRGHKFDHTMWGFLYRSTVGAMCNLVRGRLTFQRLWHTWRALAYLPFVYLGWARDFWEPFEWYLKAEENLPATYFLIPFKNRSGEHVTDSRSSRRAAAYDVTDLSDQVSRLKKKGCELGVHGLDSWHSVEMGRAELARVSAITGQPTTGIRMHWLLQDSKTAEVLERSGFSYDSTAGYNETIGYRNGTTQVFQPLRARKLLELPLHIQDGALFYSQRLDLSEQQADELSQSIIAHAIQSHGVLTVLWHDRSHAPERFWGDFYLKLLNKLKTLNVWFGSAGQVVEWFRKRREVQFEEIETSHGLNVRPYYSGGEVQPPFQIRVYAPTKNSTEQVSTTCVEIVWNGKPLEYMTLHTPSPMPAAVADPALS